MEDMLSISWPLVYNSVIIVAFADSVANRIPIARCNHQPEVVG
jgi:hypothetical protein